MSLKIDKKQTGKQETFSATFKNEKSLRELGLFRLEKRRIWETLLQPSSTWKECINRREINHLHGLTVMGQGEVALNYERRDLG